MSGVRPPPAKSAGIWGPNGGREPGFGEHPSREPYFAAIEGKYFAREA